MHPDKSATVIGFLDLRPGITPEDFEKALEELDVDKVLDANRTARVRTEQSYIRQALLGGRIDAECAVCGHRFSVDLLVCAHIKPRSCCNDAEKASIPLQVDDEEIRRLRGMLAFVKSVEPKFLARLRKKYGAATLRRIQIERALTRLQVFVDTFSGLL